MLGIPELIAESLNRQRGIPLRSIVDQHIGATVLSQGLPHQLDRLSSHLRQLLHNLRVGFCSLLGGLIGHLQRSEQPQHYEWRGKTLQPLMLLGE